jgi:cobalt-zinc-cadmium efflux system membrane fusion protein
MKWKLPITLLIIGGAAAFVTFNHRANTWARETVHKFTSTAVAAPTPREATNGDGSSASTREPFSGTISIDDKQLRTLGVELVESKSQTEPIHVEVIGKLDYDQDTLTLIRPRFAVLVSKVYVRLGRKVTKGEPLVEIFSIDLAKAKSDYEKANAQWDRDKHQLARSEELYKVKHAISEKDYLEDVNAERKSKVDAKVALDTLLLYGLSDKEIENVEEEEGEEKGHMTIRSPVDGIVIKRDVVVGTLYDVTNVLLTIAPLDHFWVWGNVYPSDASRVFLDQPWNINCGFMGKWYHRKVDSISSNIDPDTKTVRVRTTIDNEGNRLKADMLVTGYIEVAPLATRTVIPRSALISADGADYVFVKVSGGGSQPNQFTRRPVRTIQEHADFVILAEGLKVGDVVAGRGSLVLGQMYEDAASTRGITP